MATNTDFRVKNGLYVGENINVKRGSVSADAFYGNLFDISTSGALGTGSSNSISGSDTLNFEAVSGVNIAVSDNSLQFSLSLSNSFEIDSNNIDLSDTGISAGTYGSQTSIPTFIVNEQGRLTSADEVTIATTLSTGAGTGTGTVDLLSESLSVIGTSNEITTVASNNTVTVGLPNDVTIGNDLTVTGDFSVNTLLTVLSGDNVGIDTVSPNEKLTVSGNISATGTVYADAFNSKTGGSAISFNDDITLEGDITSTTGNFTTSLSAAALSGDGRALTTNSIISLAGDLGGSVALNNLDGTKTLTATIQANSVALGTDTTGNYVATIADAGSSRITVANSGSESSAVTLDIADNAVALGTKTTGNYVQSIALNTTHPSLTGSSLAAAEGNTITGLGLSATGVTANSYGSTTVIPVITVLEDGRISNISTSSIPTDLTIAGDSGSNDTVTIGTDTLTFAGTSNEVDTTVSNNQIQIGLPSAVSVTTSISSPLLSGTNVCAATSVTTPLVLGGDGSVSAPSYSFTGDTDTGMWRSGSDQLMLATGGADRLCLTSTLATFTNSVCVNDNITVAGNLIVHGDCTTLNTTVTATSAFRVDNAGTGPALVANQTGSQPVVDFQDDGTSVFYIEDGGDVGIGTSNPNEKLTVSGNISATGTVYADAFNSKTGGSAISFNDDITLDGDITSTTGNFTTSLSAAALSGDGRALTTNSTISLAGDLGGSVALNNLDGTKTLTATIQANSVALGTDTTGNYVQSLALNTTTPSLTGSSLAGAEGNTITGLGLSATGVTANSYGSSTAIPVITVLEDGRLSSVSTSSISTGLTIAADSGSNDTVTLDTDTLTFTGTSNEVDTTVSNNQIQIGLPSAVSVTTSLSSPSLSGTNVCGSTSITSPLVSSTNVYTGGNVGIGTNIANEALTVSGNVSATGTVYADAFNSKTGGSAISFNDDITLEGDITSITGNFTTSLSAASLSGDGRALTTNSTISLAGDLGGSVALNNLDGTKTLTATIQANSVALGTDTTGNYVATIADAGSSRITVANSGSESAAVTLDIADNAVALGTKTTGNYVQSLALNTTTPSLTGSSLASAEGNTITGLGLSATGVTVGNYGSSTAIPIVTVLEDGRISSASTTSVATTLSTEADTGTGTVDLLTDNLLIKGTTNEVDTSATGRCICIGLPSAVLVTTSLSSPLLSGTNLYTDGKVGICNSNPNHALSVTGNISATGDAFIDGDLTVAGEVTYTASTVTATTTAFQDNFLLESTDSGSSGAPDITLYRNSSSPANDDDLGNILFRGRNNNTQDVEYAQILTDIVDVSDGSEDAKIRFLTMTAGTLTDTLAMDRGKVGIGTTSPAGALHVEGSNGGWSYFSTNSSLDVPADKSGPILGWNYSNGNGESLIVFNTDGDGGGTAERFSIAQWSGASLTEHLTVDDGGKVGIGTVAPGYNLHVSCSSGPAAIGITGTGGSKDTWSINSSDTGGKAILQFTDVDTSSTILTLHQDNCVLPGSDNAVSLGSSSKRWANVYANCTTTGAVIESNLCTNGLDSCPEGSVVIWRDGKLQGTTDAYSHRVMGVTAPGSESPIVMGAENILVTGDIEEGDPIVTSDKYNHGMRGARSEGLHGKVIAEALERGSGESYIIRGMIRKF